MTKVFNAKINMSSTSVISVAENTPASKVCTLTSSLLMRTRNIPAHCVIIKLQQVAVLQDINSQHMRV